MAVKTVIFDIDNTMYDYTAGDKAAKAVLREYCSRQFGMSGGQFDELYRAGDRLMVSRMDRSCAAVHNRLIRFQCMMELAGYPVFPHARAMCHLYWDTLLGQMEPQPGLLEFMEDLKLRGIRIGVGTNMTAYMQYRKLERLGVESKVDWLVTSEESAAEKPDPAFFGLCVEKSGVKPGECLFIGDSLEADVHGARACGLQAVWYTALLKHVPENTGEWRYGSITSFCDCLNPGFWENK